MFSNFDATFRPWKKWQDKKLTAMNPCDKCEVHRDWLNRAIYGSPAEREDAVMTVPTECKGCVDKVIWQADCLQKLKWYEDQDERLKGV